MAIKEKINALLAQAHEGMYEREEVMALTLLASIAGESVFLLGPPGVAKSLIPRRLKYAYTNARMIEYLISGSTLPDELFRPDSETAGTVFFLNDIWKAGPDLQNALLRALNDKSFRLNEQEKPIPMKALIFASNSAPPEDRGFDALWDRILVRFTVGNIEDLQKFDAMISAPPGKDAVADKIADEEYRVWNSRIDSVRIPQNALNIIHSIRECTKQHDIYVSDCRWRKIVRLLRTSAFLNGRDEIDLMDCFLIKHCIWSKIQQIPLVSQFVDAAIENYGVAGDFVKLADELLALRTEIAAETTSVKDAKIKTLELVYEDYYEVMNPPNAYNTLIRKSDFDKLTESNYLILLGYFNTISQRVDLINSYHIRKGTGPFGIFIEDKEYKLKITIQEGKQQITKKPDPQIERQWDSRITSFLRSTAGMKEEIEQYRSKSLDHFRTNLFVKPELANIVESHITAMQNQIEQLMREIQELQKTYKNIKDEEVMLESQRR
ncbi:MAG: AAA family ATPase [Spirochaetaceae bacterium]|jgi:MoxR-like ATPase|nr:AAA family ATPase [Spirochaetaceae bacterium]